MSRTRKIVVVEVVVLACLAAWLGIRVWSGGARSAAEGVEIIDPDVRASPGDAQSIAWIEIERRPMPRIKPGTEIGEEPPAGWSHVVLHGVPRLAAGDVDRVPAIVTRLVSLLHLTILADVETDAARPPRYTLREVAIGLALKIDDREVIVSSETQKSQGADLGMVDRNTLTENEASLVDVRQIARTPSMLVFDAPSIMRFNGKNRHVFQRHALLVNPRDGGLATAVWIIEANNAGGYDLPTPTLQWLPPALEDDRMIYVDGSEFTLGIPSKEAFALVQLPQGKEAPIDAALAAVAVSRLDAAVDVRALEAQLRALLGGNREE